MVLFDMEDVRVLKFKEKPMHHFPVNAGNLCDDSKLIEHI